MQPARRYLNQAAIVVLTLAVWAVVATRIVPDKAYDRGIFVSVAERLRAGDRLYADVWDNKDPLFFWILAAGRTFGPRGDIAVEAMWLVIACASVGLLAACLGVATRTSAAVGGLAAPVLLTGGFYSAGATHLPGVAMTLAAVAAAGWRRPALSGALVTTVAALKLVILPVALLLVVLTVLHRSGWRALGRVVLGLAVGLLTFTAILAVRRELQPYLAAQQLNFSYSQNGVLLRPGHELSDHLLRGLGLPGGLVSLVMIALATASWLLTRHVPPDQGGSELSLLRRLIWAAVGSGILVLAITGLWPHHAQVLYVAGGVCLVLVARHVDPDAARTPWAIAALLLTAVALSGTALPQRFARTHTSAAQRLEALTTPSPETTALLAAAPSGSYARLGQHDDQGHAEGLGAWTLACPRFHQYPWDDPEILDQVLVCARSQPYLIVSDSIAPETVDSPRLAPWDDYVEQVEQVLAEDYDCTRYSTGRICHRRAP